MKDEVSLEKKGLINEEVEDQSEESSEDIKEVDVDECKLWALKDIASILEDFKDVMAFNDVKWKLYDL